MLLTAPLLLVQFGDVGQYLVLVLLLHMCSHTATLHTQWRCQRETAPFSVLFYYYIYYC